MLQNKITTSCYLKVLLSCKIVFVVMERLNQLYHFNQFIESQ